MGLLNTRMHRTHLSLHHVWPVEAQIKDNAVYVCRVLRVQLLQHPIQDDEGSSSAHSGTKTHAADLVESCEKVRISDGQYTKM